MGRIFPQVLFCIFCITSSSVVLTFSNKIGNNNGTARSSTVSQTEQEFANWAGRQFASRMLWMTHQRRFVLPKGTILQITPKITVPVFRHAPYDGGFDSDIQAAWTFYMKFDKLNMTSDDHPWPFDMPPFYPFGEMMRPMVNVQKTVQKPVQNHFQNFHKHEYGPPFPNIHYAGSESEESKSKKLHTIRSKNVYPVFKGLHRRPRRSSPKRAIMSLPPAASIFGGERANIFPSLEKILGSLGLEGRPCLLRAVCEVHEYPLKGGYGIFGELVTLFFSISESSYAESHMPEYLKAERMGKEAKDCSSYKENCSRSIFVWEPRAGFTFADSKPEVKNEEVHQVKDKDKDKENNEI